MLHIAQPKFRGRVEGKTWTGFLSNRQQKGDEREAFLFSSLAAHPSYSSEMLLLNTITKSSRKTKYFKSLTYVIKLKDKQCQLLL